MAGKEDRTCRREISCQNVMSCLCQNAVAPGTDGKTVKLTGVFFSLQLPQTLLGQKFLIICSHSCLQFSAFIVLPSPTNAQPEVAEKLLQSQIQTVECYLFLAESLPLHSMIFFFQPYSNRMAQDVSSISFPLTHRVDVFWFCAACD